MPNLSDAPLPVTPATTPTQADVAAQNQASSRNSIQGKAVLGAKIMAFRTVISLILRVVSSITLARLLDKSDYGIYGIIIGIISIGFYVCEFSLNTLLIIQKEEPTPDETATIFWFQQGVSVCYVAVVCLASSLILRSYNVDQTYVPMLCIGTSIILMSTFRSVPVAMMERHLRFELIARAEVTDQAVQIAFSIALAFAGLGAWAMMISVIIARFAEMCVMRANSDWRLTGRFQWSIARRMIRKAVPLQLNQVSLIATSNLVSLLMARNIGVAAVGLVSWSGNIAMAPILLVTMLHRVAFPAMSRLQENPSEVGRITGRASRRTVTLMGLLVAPIAIVAPLLLPVVFGAKWQPAVVLFQWNISEVILHTAHGMLVQALMAMGFAKQRTVISTTGALIRAGLIYVGMRLLGVQGIVIGSYCGTLLEVIILTAQVRRRIPGSDTIWRDVFVPVLRIQGALAVTMLSAKFVLRQETPTIVGTLGQLVLFAGLVALPDLFSASRPIISELVGTWDMVRARRVASQ